MLSKRFSFNSFNVFMFFLFLFIVYNITIYIFFPFCFYLSRGVVYITFTTFLMSIVLGILIAIVESIIPRIISALRKSLEYNAKTTKKQNHNKLFFKVFKKHFKNSLYYSKRIIFFNLYRLLFRVITITPGLSTLETLHFFFNIITKEDVFASSVFLLFFTLILYPYFKLFTITLWHDNLLVDFKQRFNVRIRKKDFPLWFYALLSTFYFILQFLLCIILIIY